MKQKHIDLYSQTHQKPTEDIQQSTQKQPVNYEMLKLQVRINNQPQGPQGTKTNTPCIHQIQILNHILSRMLPQI